MDIKTHAGNAWVDLKLNLGEYQPSQVVEFQKRLSPSRIRHRERRAALFKQNEDRGLEEQNSNFSESKETKETVLISDSLNVTEKVAFEDVAIVWTKQPGEETRPEQL